jgi:flagellar motor switch protein FliG
MLKKTQAYLSRFKNNDQGMIEFATLVEQADPPHREMILKAAEEEDPRFLSAAMRRVVYFEEMIYIDEMILAEILSKVSPKVLAYALRGTSEEFRKLLLKTLGHRELKQTRDEEDQVREDTPEALVLGARRQILKIARMLEAQQKFVFEVLECPRLARKRKKAAP